jgi:hypothetical protein
VRNQLMAGPEAADEKSGGSVAAPAARWIAVTIRGS